jgi:gamma-glutamyltranspeptidase/glutathione hydrolase
MDLHTAGHRRGVCCAPHSAAVEAGRDVLAEGGNALEAMIAMAATIAAVYPHMNHIGGDGFWLVHESSGRVRALMAAGPAGAKATPRFYKDHGCDEIPSRGPLAALTVPGAIGGWMLALEAAKAFGGRLPLDVLLGAAIRYARDGYVVTRSQAQLKHEKLDELKDLPGFAETFLKAAPPVHPREGGDPESEKLDSRLRGNERTWETPKTGETLRQSALAATLDHLTHAGLADFYRGDIGREIAADLERIDSPVTRADLEGYSAKVEAPLSIKLETGTLYNAPPPTQGLASLIILALYERLRIAEAESFDHVHGIVEATKRAFRVRDKVATDPARITIPLQQFLEKPFLDSEIRRIDRRKAAPWPAPPGDGDTIWMGAADSSGLVVSYIQSVYWEFGSGCVLPATGVMMQNRGASFSLDPKALNTLAPGRMPFHTLNPALAIMTDGHVMAYGAMGGDGQPQSQAAVFTRHVLYRQPLDKAIDAPRWLLGRTWGSTHTSLRMEPRFDGNLIDRLLSAGHDVDVLSEGYSDTMGHAGAAIFHPDGTMEAAHDPRADGGAAGV